MKQILLVSHKMNLGGTEKALLALLEELRAYKDIEVELLFLEKGGVLEKEIPDYVKVSYFEGFDEIKPIIENPPLETIKNFAKKGKFAAAAKSFATYAKIKSTGDWFYNYIDVLKNYKNAKRYDIAVAFAGPSDFISYLIAEKINAGKKIQWIHFDIGKIVSNFNFGKRFYPGFDKIFCVSEGAKTAFLKFFPQFENKTEVFPNIISENDIRSKADSGKGFADNFDGFRVLTVGRFTKEKGQIMMPDTVQKLLDKNLNFKWYLVGDGVERPQIEKKVADQNLESKIIFLGEQVNPYPFMKECDIYVQPSFHEGYGITVAEAKAFAKPIVVTNFASAKDLVEDGKTGFIAEINADDIAGKLEKLLLDEYLRHSFSENIRSETIDNHGLIQKLLN